MINTAIILTILQIIFLEGVLSVDNAAALGALVKVLPNNEPVPWPRWAPFGHRFDRALGSQRSAALKVGLLGAYLGRALMLALATTVMEQPWLRIIGGLYLLFLAVDYLGQRGADQQADADTPRHLSRSSFWGVVLTVELVDLAFSLDNVVAVVALSQDYWVVLGGVAIGILIMRFAANIFTRMITWEPNLEITAYLLVGAISLELLLNELFGIHFSPQRVGGIVINAEAQQFAVSITIVLLTLAFARIRWLAPWNVIWQPLLWVCMVLRAVIQWLLTPLRTLLQALRGNHEVQPNE